MSAVSVERQWPALYSRANRKVLNPHEFHIILSPRVAANTKRDPSRLLRDIWEADGVRRSSRLRLYERDAASRPPPVAPDRQLSATAQLDTLGQYNIHPVVELDYVGPPPALHRYPHLRKFCSMVEFDLLSPQRVAAFWCTSRLFPERISEIFCFDMRARALLGAQRYNEHFAWPSLAELLEMCEVYREYFRPTQSIASELAKQHKALFDAAQSLVGQVFLSDSLNESFRMLVFLAFVLRPLCTGRRAHLLRQLFDYVAETRTSCRRANRRLLAVLEAQRAEIGAEQLTLLLMEFRLSKRKFALLYPNKLDKSLD